MSSYTRVLSMSDLHYVGLARLTVDADPRHLRGHRRHAPRPAHLALVEALVQREDGLNDEAARLHGVAGQVRQLRVCAQGEPVPSPLTRTRLVIMSP